MPETTKQTAHAMSLQRHILSTTLSCQLYCIPNQHAGKTSRPACASSLVRCSHQKCRSAASLFSPVALRSSSAAMSTIAWISGMDRSRTLLGAWKSAQCKAHKRAAQYPHLPISSRGSKTGRELCSSATEVHPHSQRSETTVNGRE